MIFFFRFCVRDYENAVIIDNAINSLYLCLYVNGEKSPTYLLMTIVLGHSKERTKLFLRSAFYFLHLLAQSVRNQLELIQTFSKYHFLEQDQNSKSKVSVCYGEFFLSCGGFWPIYSKWIGCWNFKRNEYYFSRPFFYKLFQS